MHVVVYVFTQIARMSMEVVQRELEKNMDKFDLYVRRNALLLPEHLREEVAAIRTREKKKHDKTEAENAKVRALQDAQTKLRESQREVEARRREILQVCYSPACILQHLERFMISSKTKQD